MKQINPKISLLKRPGYYYYLMDDGVDFIL